MEQLASQAYALQIYQELTHKLYSILKQLQSDQQQMENKIITLQQQINQKNIIIKQLQQKLNISSHCFSAKQNHVQVFADIQSQPLLGQKKQTISTVQSFDKNYFKIDINSYFKDLINKMGDKQSTNQSSQFTQSRNSCQNIELIKLYESCQQEERTQNLLQNIQKIQIEHPMVLTRVQTKQTDYTDEGIYKQIQLISSNKQNVYKMSINESLTDIFLPFQYQLQSFNKKLNDQKLSQNNKQRYKQIQGSRYKYDKQQKYNSKLNKNTLNVSNFMIQKIKPRKQSFNTLIKYPSTLIN